MPFTEINNIKAHTDEQGVDVYLANDSVYTFTRFQRPESAVAFLLNFWNMIRKEKFVFRHSQVSSRADLSSSSGPAIQSNSANSTTPESLRIPKFPTTISLNSSASISESDSADSKRRDMNSTSSEHMRSSSHAEMRSGEEKTSDIYENSTESILTDSKINPTVVRVTYTSQAESADIKTPGAKTLGLKANNYTVNASDGKCEDRENMSSSHSIRKNVNLPHSASAPTARQLHGLQRSSCPSRTRPNHPCLSETPSWSLWPVSFLPYPFSPPQRLTMIIAYAILGFLLFSTMHLYHRLAVFDLQGNPFARNPSFADSPGTMKPTLQALELQLTELVELTGRLAQSLMHMTDEMREIRLNEGSSVPGTTSAATDQQPPAHPEPRPPV
ncbi:hypothetical protein D915_000281 [Fasciola hepatica]|uniref:GRAM domain-containing protein n=1 Tax=Fasciola hepatica TaxID=6192 RepID=A0A4E0S485_FASHE|nr:hypothetical protein D915_000281 [Fasciola hepatica]